jgi:hypothetical protein
LKRAAAIARQALVVQRTGLLRRRKLETAQPKLEADAGRDGWDTGREWLADDFRKLLQRTPLSYWTDDCDLGIKDSLELIAELGADFLLVLLTAVQQRGSVDWVRGALDAVDASLMVAIGGAHHRADQVPLALIARLPAEEQSPVAERLLRLLGGAGWTTAVGLALPLPWSEAFSLRFVEQLRLGVDQPAQMMSLPTALQLAVLRGEPGALQQAMQKALERLPVWPTDESALQRYRTVWQDALRLLDKRQAIRRAFFPPSNGNTV